MRGRRLRQRWRRRIEALIAPPDISIGHTFHRPPYGGSNQFLLALRHELEGHGLRVSENLITPRTRACLLNSFVFDEDALRRDLHPACRVVHRIDGPVGIYRGLDEGIDARLSAVNLELADATIFQSRYSLEAHRDLGLAFRSPVVIPNAVDPRIFFQRGSRPPLGRKVRLIATSWSDNPNKGAATFRWLEQRLDWSRFEFTFAGRSPVEFERIRVVPPVGSKAVAELLRSHDVYVFASRHESCSNALLEALACGLPVVYVASGGNAELVGDAGIAFASDEELPGALDQLVEEYGDRCRSISLFDLREITRRYLEVMGLE